jgi:nicotinate-nucleotide pyrophosphorylase (carboxylating)
MSLPRELADRLRESGLNPRYVEDFARAAIEEDLDGGVDVTTESTVDEAQRGSGELIARADGVVAGVEVAEVVFYCATRGKLEVGNKAADGDVVKAGDVVMSVSGGTRALLLAERTALNLVCRLSGIATVTRQWAEAIAGTGAAIRDTRKTTPLLRPLEKYAVRCGGGENHRMSLSEAALVKDNHVIAAGGVAAAFQAVAATFPGVPVEIEVDDIAGAVEAAEAGANLVLLDNFSVDDVRAAVQAVGDRTRLEVSGGLSLESVRAYAETGVDYLAVGALTHSAPALDIAFDLREVH